MNKSDCKDCVCLVRGENDEWNETETWICDELNCEISEIVNCPEGDKE